jgi:hypothetical protein
LFQGDPQLAFRNSFFLSLFFDDNSIKKKGDRLLFLEQKREEKKMTVPIETLGEGEKWGQKRKMGTGPILQERGHSQLEDRTTYRKWGLSPFFFFVPIFLFLGAKATCF